MHGIEESSANNPSKQKACQQSVEPTVKHKGAKDAIKALTSKLQSMSPRAFMRKQAKAHVDTPTCARQLMYSSTHGTCDIEARDINNSCNATPVLVLHTSHGVNTSPSDDTRDKNSGISGSRKHGKEESSSNNPSKQKACQQSVEPTVKRKGAKDAIKALTSKLPLPSIVHIGMPICQVILHHQGIDAYPSIVLQQQ
ncbi:PH, RCC1 and FYVE domains-containing protein 1, partial [Tanacetum coccineum]